MIHTSGFPPQLFARGGNDDPMRVSSTDLKFMRRCLTLAAKGIGHTSPNPHVGCVIAKNGKIIAEGYHHQAGLPHAEIEALKKTNFKAVGATLYCNLEPCNHHGRTPPCVDRVIASGVKRVVIAHRDPNPKVAGKSVRKMEKAGIEVIEGVCEDEARFLNRFFLKWITKGRPYVIVKVGVSADGMLVRSKVKGQNIYITSRQSLKDVHKLRSQVDAILVGSNTILADDPQLNVRGIKNARQPLRIVLDRRGRVPKTAKIFHSAGGDVWILKQSSSGLPRPLGPRNDVRQILKIIGSQNVTSLLVEGGYHVLESFFKSQSVDEVLLYISSQVISISPLPSIWPLMEKAFRRFQLSDTAFCGPDLKLTLLRK